MENNVSPQSLLPWLNTKNIVFIANLFIFPPGLDSETRFQPRLQIISNSNPFVRVLRAQLVTDTGSNLKDIFLFQQKDAYCYSANMLEKISNTVINAHWQHNYSLLKNDSPENGFIDLSPQDKSERSFAPYRSLFYCQLRQEYFHPPCPDCGTLLEECTDEQCLSDSGLQSYSTSLKRYLYCPSCSEPKFYTYQLDDTDPDGVSDRFDLIHGFGKLLHKNAAAEFFPCVDCDNKGECFGSKSLVTSRVIPFSFYNFRMFMFAAMTLSSFDFLGLVSGASVCELKGGIDSSLEPGRLTCLEAIEKHDSGQNNFLFINSDEWFLEVLFLKLCYLQQLSSFALSAEALKTQSDLEISLEQFWVDFPAGGNLLPSLWNFTVKPLGGSFGASPETTSILPVSLRVYSFVLIWFSTLLVNSQQSIDSIRAFLSTAIRSNLVEQFPADLSSAMLAAENIFWHPMEQKVGIQWQPFWNRSLRLGWSLLQDFQGHLPGWQSGAFVDEIECLAEEVKNILFQSQPSKTTAANPDDSSENRLIGELLLGIKDKWLALDAFVEDSSVAETGDGIKATETVEEQAVTIHEDDDKTVILKAPTLAPEDLDKTVLLPIDNNGVPDTDNGVIPIPVEDKNQDHLDKTVLLSVNNNVNPPTTHASQPLPKGVENQDHLDKTVILNADELANRLKKKGND